MLSKITNKLRKQNSYNFRLEQYAAKVAAKFSAMIRVLEKEIVDKTYELFANVKFMSPEFNRVFISRYLDEVADMIASSLVLPLSNPEEVIWESSDNSIIRRAIAMSVIMGSKYAFIVSNDFIAPLVAKDAFGQMRFVFQSQVAQRVKSLAIAFEQSIRDWTYTQISVPLFQGQASEAVLAEVNQEFQKDKLPWRVAGLSVPARAATIGQNETKLSYSAVLGALAIFAMSKQPTELKARSLAIHDDKVADDSLEAEELTEDWVGYPEPYFSMTSFRRRPNDRCFDAVLTVEEAEEISFEQEE